MVSTEAGAQDRLQALQAGANSYLIKPIKPDQLLTQVRLLIGTAQA
jgi:two-component system chemotaxis response regulator CheY